MRHFPPRQPKQGGHWSPGRDRATQAAFRKLLITNAGGLICQRCGRTDRPVEAHHDTPTTGRLLCAGKDGCHRLEDPYAR